MAQRGTRGGRPSRLRDRQRSGPQQRRQWAESAQAWNEDVMQDPFEEEANPDQAELERWLRAEMLPELAGDEPVRYPGIQRRGPKDPNVFVIPADVYCSRRLVSANGEHAGAWERCRSRRSVVFRTFSRETPSAWYFSLVCAGTLGASWEIRAAKAVVMALHDKALAKQLKLDREKGIRLRNYS